MQRRRTRRFEWFVVTSLLSWVAVSAGCGDDGASGPGDGGPDARKPAVCGDGVLDPGEECDDGPGNSDTAPDACRSDCTLPRCGDGVADTGEQCDELDLRGRTCETLGMTAGVLSCTPDCQYDTDGCSTCGNGKVEAEEECDGTNLAGGTCATVAGKEQGVLGCDETCHYDTSGCWTCGDGVKEGEEECDGSDFGDATCGDYGFQGGSLRCGEDCRLDFTDCTGGCGNGILEGQEECDDGNRNLHDACPDGPDGTCQSARCGDGYVWNEDGGTETCDDGNEDVHDSCPDGPNGTCLRARCGDGFVWNEDGGTETCDDGNAEAGDGCAGCQVEQWWSCHGDPSECEPVCGDGHVVEGIEGCDDGNQNLHDACPDGPGGTCQPARCGDGIVWNEDGGTETCDDGDGNVHDACPDGPDGSCQDARCGDGILWTEDGGTEECDDGDAESGDGCSDSCLVETGWLCSGEPSTCSCLPYHHGPDCSQCIVYADGANTNPNQDGLTWNTAFHDLAQAAATAEQAAIGDEVCQVWASGTFYQQEASRIVLSPHVVIYGGLLRDATSLDGRDPESHPTTVRPAGQFDGLVQACGGRLDGLTFDDPMGSVFATCSATAYPKAATVVSSVFEGVALTELNGLRHSTVLLETSRFAQTSASIVASTFEFRDCRFDTDWRLSAIDSTLTFQRCSFLVPTGGQYGGMGLAGRTAATFEDCEFGSGNVMAPAVVQVTECSSAVFRRCSFSGINSTVVSVSADCPNGTEHDLLVEESTFRNNPGTPEFGLVFVSSGRGVVVGSTFESNGRGLLVAQGPSSVLEVWDATFLHDSSWPGTSQYEPVVTADQGGTVSLINTLVHCRGSQAFDCLMVRDGGHLTLRNTTVYHGGVGNAVMLATLTNTDTNFLDVYNSIIWPTSGVSIAPEPPGDQTQQVRMGNSDVLGSQAWDWSGDLGGNLDEDPLFVAPSSGNFHLRSTSPCVGTGLAGYLPQDVLDLDGDGDASELLPVDLDGHPRVVGSVDMGCYER